MFDPEQMTLWEYLEDPCRTQIFEVNACEPAFGISAICASLETEDTRQTAEAATHSFEP